MAHDVKGEDIGERDANRDPITGAPGSHPVGTGLGAAAGGAAAGAAAGAVGGPAGALIGAAAGAIIGGLAGKAVAENFDPTAEDAHWEREHVNEPYYRAEYTYVDYQPAYRTGYMGRSKSSGRTFEKAEPELRAEYERNRGNSRMSWDDSRSAVRAAWHRLDHMYPDSD